MAGDAQEVRSAAMRLLARREHSRLELQRKLKERGHESDVVAEVLQALEQERLLSDQRYAESYVRMRSERGYGPVRIHHELQERGVSDELVGRALEAAEINWYELAARVRKQRFGDQPIADFKEQARQMRFLQYRGFEHGQIKAVCKDD